MGNFNLSILSSGGGGGSGSGIAKYASAGLLPGTAADGDVAIVLDTNNLYSYDTGVGAWVIIGGPGVAVTVSDTDSIDTTFTANDISSNLRIPPGITGIPTQHSGITLQIFAGASPGLVAFVRGFPVGETTSSILQFSGQTFPMLGGTLLLSINQATGSTPGYLSAADWTTFNNKVGISAIIQTVFPILGGTNIPSSGGITLSIPAANGTTGGYLSSADWTIFGKKLSGLTGPLIASNSAGDSGAIVAVMQSRGLTLGNFPLIDPSTFLGNPAGTTQGVTTITTTVAKSLLGISNSNFGDVTLGAFLYLASASGATISAAQVLSLCWGDTSNPGLVGPTHQVWSGDKRTLGSLGASWFQMWGSSLISFGSTQVTTGYTLVYVGNQGGTYSYQENDGLGNLRFRYNGTLNGYRTVSNAGATLNIQDRVVEVTTGSTNQTLNIGFAASGNTGLVLHVMKIDSGLGSVTMQSPDLINGVSNFTFASQWEAHQLICNGIGWRVFT